ncbi:YhcN/YlaJ family sporulation lipoprotein [Aquibacillus saliphilus]|uniref:YhcN/YlaJ family sporulation lipoprotein n=1 Tax=Aquibacillus saliphilus TaxID=1909422 RepID=UPI001CF0200C|nr:YhcN/YlaJ family sporulation lipoprotein [Aquibacillus saliphilus]
MKNVFKSSFFLLLFCFIVGCNNQNEEALDRDKSIDDNYHPLAYNTKSEEEKRIREHHNAKDNQGKNQENIEEQYLNGFQKDMNNPRGTEDSYTKSFYNQDSETISKEINELDEVRLTQTIVTDEQIIISAMLKQEYYDVNLESIAEKIRSKAEQTIPNKKVVVYTDAIYWNKMRDLNSRMKSEDNPDKKQYHLDNFFR